MARQRRSQYQTLGGSDWYKARAELKARGDAYCWRGCGTWLLTDAPKGHPQHMTLGHVVALEDGGAKYDPNNLMPECAPCNYADGARRKNNKAAGRPNTPARQSYTNPQW